jgi:DNA-binding transcriptional MerR regulator
MRNRTSNVFRLKVSAVSRASSTSVETVRKYVALGLLECVRDSAGQRLFADDAPARVIEIRESRRCGKAQ